MTKVLQCTFHLGLKDVLHDGYELFDQCSVLVCYLRNPLHTEHLQELHVDALEETGEHRGAQLVAHQLLHRLSDIHASHFVVAAKQLHQLTDEHICLGRSGLVGTPHILTAVRTHARVGGALPCCRAHGRQGDRDALWSVAMVTAAPLHLGLTRQGVVHDRRGRVHALCRQGAVQGGTGTGPVGGKDEGGGGGGFGGDASQGAEESGHVGPIEEGGLQGLIRGGRIPFHGAASLHAHFLHDVAREGLGAEASHLRRHCLLTLEVDKHGLGHLPRRVGIFPGQGAPWGVHQIPHDTTNLLLLGRPTNQKRVACLVQVLVD